MTVRCAYLTAVHGRHAVVRMAAAHLVRLGLALAGRGIELRPLFVLSPGDVPALADELASVGVAWMAAANLPVSVKFQAGLAAVRPLLGPVAAVMLAGSDDFISGDYAASAIGQAVTGGRCVQPTRLHIYDLPRRQLWRVGEDRGFGAGRVFPAAVLDRVNWTVWPFAVNSGLDGKSRLWLRRCGCGFADAISLAPIVDVKGFGNVHEIDELRRRLELLPVIGGDDVLAACGLSCIDGLSRAAVVTEG